jgi:cysteine-rich repeat protein
MCGNGTTEDGEICDDGNTNDGDQCSSDCQNYCPIGQIWKDGACASTAQSSSDNSSSSSQQDVPAKKVVINEIPETDPTELCGNGVLDEGEECDDGNNEDLDGCSNNCFKEEIEFQNEDGSLFFPSTSAIEQSEETASDGSVTILVLIIACFVSYLAGLLFFLFKRRQSNVEKEAERVTKKI